MSCLRRALRLGLRRRLSSAAADAEAPRRALPRGAAWWSRGSGPSPRSPAAWGPPGTASWPAGARCARSPPRTCGSLVGTTRRGGRLSSSRPGSPPSCRAGRGTTTDEALRDANWLPSEDDKKDRTGVSIGGGIGSISDILDASQMILENRLRRLSPYFIPKILINMASGHVSMRYGFQGPNHAAVTACATGAHSIGDATRMIQFGDADVMVAGGTESSIDALLRALSTKYNSLPQAASRPFDCGRDGFVIGEGCGVMVLEALEHAKERGAKIYAEVRGYGMSGDAHHITQPQNDGRGATLAMKRALEQADQIDYLNAHATSTPLGDAIEANAVKSVFGDHATSGGLALSSTKGAIGHLLGAAGSVEAIFTVLAIHHGIAPPTLNLEQPDPLFEGAFMPLSSRKKMPIRAAISNSFGFGGTNTSLLFSRPP
uniref:beta-ketoacyl-[acyl-carrier-protein] synthase I n=1 Tax=Leersia perrieri TaxID=77586 RepID=A0A0D9VDC5_9ORYZ